MDLAGRARGRKKKKNAKGKKTERDGRKREKGDAAHASRTVSRSILNAEAHSLRPQRGNAINGERGTAWRWSRYYILGGKSVTRMPGTHIHFTFATLRYLYAKSCVPAHTKKRAAARDFTCARVHRHRAQKKKPDACNELTAYG